MLNSVLNGDWSNSVPGRKIPEGMISNSVTHLRSYTNSAIAYIAPISSLTPRDRRHRRAERRRLRIERRYRRIE